MAPLGNLVRLLPLHINELPAHPALESLVIPHSEHTRSAESSPSQAGKVDSSERPNLISFMEEVLDQATIFVDDTLPATFKEGNLKKSAPATAKVRLLSRNISEAEIQAIPWINSSIPRNWSNGRKPAEAWFARRSRHANHSDEGTADLDEFDFGLRHDHSKHEQEYTPDVFDSYKVLDWDLSMSIHEMCHELPAMLSNRVFPVLVVTAKRGKHSFVVVQIPVDISGLTVAMYSNGRNLRKGDSAVKRKKPVLGVYTSIERCQMLPDQNVEWVMATASDAKGWLPMWAQKMGVPSAVVKDVGLFIGWVKTRRPLFRKDPPFIVRREDGTSTGVNGD
ncbi:hypothetical protein HO133_008792 [Letharia lupina]|uniref:DUF3074 domain-containing protein n=1 Tax=Letharia lupina TaxID=560253 RepID=A0A8H6CPV2_9LECA|nr:uncharacterized protein HO133_008792 [Letharia lupina]KAF6227348.1 hypothetical protein HO133_008792 [Letharia lupina]